MAQPQAVSVETPSADVQVERQADGSVIINLETRKPRSKPANDKFDANLAEDIGDAGLSEIATEVIEGINADLQSRSEWINNYNKGIQLLGLKIEDVNKTETQLSTVRHPMLLHAVVKGQSLAQAEMLPAAGPCKVMNTGDLPQGVAEDLESSMNWYMTTVMTEYYPDTDRMLFYEYFGGTTFKKVYRDPLLRRPTSRFVELPDLIVSQGATDLQTALRVTHRIEMSKNDVRRYQRAKHWVDVDLPDPVEHIEETDQAEAIVTGISSQRTRREDWPYTIYECYTKLDLDRWDLKEKSLSSDDAGVELPYRVTIDADSQTVLEIRRNWKQKDPLFLPRRRFVKFGLIPGLGFLSLGYLHLLGNHTRALTALERILIDAGIFASFPGGVKARGIRGESNIIRPSPGEFVEIDGPDGDITKAIMPLPFKGPTAECLALLQHLEGQGEKTVGIVEVVSGEGSTNVPVGTIMAQIEQATQTLLAVHKRQHQSQAEELSLLRELLIEQPELLRIPDKEQKWTPDQLASMSLVPASDPNVPAHIHRIMQAWVLEMLSTAHPEMYNRFEVQKRILSAARVQPDGLLVDPSQMPQGQDPTAAIEALYAKIEEMKVAQKDRQMQVDAALAGAEMERKTKETKVKGAIAAAELDQADRHHAEELADKAADRSSKEQMSEFAQHTENDMRAQELQATMDSERLAAVTEHRGLDIEEKGMAAGMAHEAAQADRDHEMRKTEHATGLASEHQDRQLGEQARQDELGMRAKEHEDGVQLEREGLGVQAASTELSNYTAQRGQDKSAQAKKQQSKQSKKGKGKRR